MFTDTHCHIHEADYPDSEAAYGRAKESGVDRMIAVGTSVHTSKKAVDFAASHDNVWASLGIHPHDAHDEIDGVESLEALWSQTEPGVIVAIGECGLDYFYENSPKEDQIKLLHEQLAFAQSHELPVIFHVREAFDDFWPIYDQYPGLKGVVHSFTDTATNLAKAIERNLYIGVNGIATFTKDPIQRAMYASVPLENLLLETDSPFLTPVPLRGKVNEPAFVAHVAKYLSDLHSVSLEELSVATQRNATTLFLNKK